MVAVSGKSGQLGRELALLAPGYPEFEFLFLSQETFPLDDEEKMKAWLKANPVRIFINCAAYTAVDKAETEQETAYRINGEAPGIIAGSMAASGGKFIQISTDYVFDGRSSTPLNEAAATDPINVYGASKRKGEQEAMNRNPDTVVIRTSWLYSAFGHNFVKTMLRLMAEREQIQVVSDQVGSPTYAADLADAILKIISAKEFIPGIYHYSNEGKASWFEFASEIKKITGSSCTVLPVESSGYPTAAKRPAYSLLDKSKIRSIYKISIPEWRTSLVRCLDLLMKSKV